MSHNVYPSLRGKRVIVTGGGSGIGAAITEIFARQGSRVAFIDIADGDSHELERKLTDTQSPPRYYRCDLTNIEAIRETFARIRADIGPIDVLVNNAANDQRHSVEDVTPEYWDQRIAINQRPLFFTCQAVLPGMKAKGGGSIINIGSISWIAKGAGYPVYATAKAATHGLTRGMARDLGKHNVRVNTVTPGWVMTQRQVDLWVDAAAEEEIARSQCLPGKLLPEHIAAMCLFLGADDSAMCTAQDFIVDAGWV